MSEDLQVKDIMTTKVVTLGINDTLATAVKMFERHNYDGFPVVDQDGRLQGIVTEYDLLVQGAQKHLPTAFNLKDANSDSKDQFEKLKQIKVSEVMTVDPLVINADAKVEDLAKEFAQHHKVNPIPVIDADKKLLGVVSRYDIIRFFNQQYFHDITEGKHEGIFKRLANLDIK
jgi:CBS domain-containing protein